MNIYCYECEKELEIKKDINTEIHVFGHVCEQDASLIAAMQARIEKLAEYPERLRKAITELEAMAASPAFTEKARILAKIEGVKLALGYFEEMTR